MPSLTAAWLSKRCRTRHRNAAGEDIGCRGRLAFVGDMQRSIPAETLNNSPAKCVAPPALCDAKVSSPGLALAIAISSGPTWWVAMKVRQVQSLKRDHGDRFRASYIEGGVCVEAGIGSQRRRGEHYGVTVRVDRTTFMVPKLPLAPAMLSMTTGTPERCVRWRQMMRETPSADLLAGTSPISWLPGQILTHTTLLAKTVSKAAPTTFKIP